MSFHFIWENIHNQQLVVTHISTLDKFADILTKPLSKDSFYRHLTKLAVVPHQLPVRGYIITCDLYKYILLYYDSLTMSLGILLFKLYFHGLF